MCRTMADLRQDSGSVPRIALVGCGAIGSLLDEDAAQAHSLTHAAALQRNPGWAFEAVCDQDGERARGCAARRGLSRAFSDVDTMLGEVRPDALVVATPPSARKAVIERALAHGVKLIFCEKPLAREPAEARIIAARVEDAGVTFALGYFRRWSPVLGWLQEQLSGGALGAPRRATGHYGKGLLNNGSHLIDMSNALFGEPVSVQAFGPALVDYDAQDPTLEAVVNYSLGGHEMPVTLLAADRNHFNLFEFDLLCEKGRMRMVDLGRELEIYHVAEDPEYRGYRRLVLAERRSGGMDGTLDRAYAQLLEVYHGRNQAPACGLAEGLKALDVVTAIRRSERERQKVTLLPV